jgi:hypothetical protein
MKSLHANVLPHLQQAAGVGIYSPYGDPHILALLQQELQRHLAARQQQQVLAARLSSGGDPYVGAYAELQSRLQGQGELARGLSAARLQLAQGAQGFLRQLEMQRRQEELQRWLAQHMQGGGLAQFGGELAGALGGGLIRHYLPSRQSTG